MQERIADLLAQLKLKQTNFIDVVAFIENHYHHIPTAFKNGAIYNEATQNQGSAKVFSFAQQNELSETDTLSLFAEHYQAVLEAPIGTDHQNIRQFMANGWAGIVFEGTALEEKNR